MICLRIRETSVPNAVKRGRPIVNIRLPVGMLSTLILYLTTFLLLQIKWYKFVPYVVQRIHYR
jgi:hypothetical protein